VPLTSQALDVIEALPPRVDTKLVFPAAEGGYIGLDTWRTLSPNHLLSVAKEG
jgi:hypothetical protein